MRIAFLSVSDQLGGSEVALLEMIRGIRRHRPAWSVHLILPGRGPLLERAEADGADCVVVRMPGSLARVGEFAAANAPRRALGTLMLGVRLMPAALALPGYVRKLRRVLRSQRASILHTNGIKAHVLGARVAGDLKVVWHVHDYLGDRRVTRSLMRSHQGRVSAVLANSASVAADVKQALAPSVPIDVVHNAVDLGTFAPEGPIDDLDRHAGWGAPRRPLLRVGLIASFARWKGHDVFLRALSALPVDLPLRGYVIGEPLYDTAGSQWSFEELRAMTRQLGLEDRVAFTGFLRPAPAMRALDVVVHASTRPEPFGLVIAEAMACGRAVVTSGSGGAGELIEPEVDALTHAPGDAAGLARAVARLAADPQLRQQLGARARVAACQRFDPDRLARELIAVYERLT